MIEFQWSVKDLMANIPKEMCERILENLKRLVTECISQRDQLKTAEQKLPDLMFIFQFCLFKCVFRLGMSKV